MTGKLEIEGNAVGNKFRTVGAGAPRKCPSVRKEHFDFFSDIATQGKIVKENFPVTGGIFIPRIL